MCFYDGIILGSGSAARRDRGGAGPTLLGTMPSVAALAGLPQLEAPSGSTAASESNLIVDGLLCDPLPPSGGWDGGSSATIGWLGWGSVSSRDLCRGRDAAGPSEVGSQDSEVGVCRNGGATSGILGGTEGAGRGTSEGEAGKTGPKSDRSDHVGPVLWNLRGCTGTS